MLKRIRDRLYIVSNGWVVLCALVVFILFILLVLPNQTSTNQIGIEDAGSPDLSFFYTPNDLYDMADAYGEQGRRDYINARFTFDVVWPIVYTAFLTTALSWISTKVFTEPSKLMFSNILPLFGALFDYFENISTSIVMARYPKHTMIIDLLAAVFTPLKWICISFSFLLLLYAVVRLLSQKIRETHGFSKG